MTPETLQNYRLALLVNRFISRLEPEVHAIESIHLETPGPILKATIKVVRTQPALSYQSPIDTQALADHPNTTAIVLIDSCLAEIRTLRQLAGLV